MFTGILVERSICMFLQVFFLCFKNKMQKPDKKKIYIKIKQMFEAFSDFWIYAPLNWNTDLM